LCVRLDETIVREWEWEWEGMEKAQWESRENGNWSQNWEWE